MDLGAGFGLAVFAGEDFGADAFAGAYFAAAVFAGPGVSAGAALFTVARGLSATVGVALMAVSDFGATFATVLGDFAVVPLPPAVGFFTTELVFAILASLSAGACLHACCRQISRLVGICMV